MRQEMKRIKAILTLVAKQVEAAEAALGAALARLAALDGDIARLVIERAQSAAALGDESFSAVEMRRRMAALRIEELRRKRAETEAAVDRMREEIKRALRQKIALEGALTAAAEEEKRRSRDR
jgi:50S ribosomal subunit-associated GTPase HflX